MRRHPRLWNRHSHEDSSRLYAWLPSLIVILLFATLTISALALHYVEAHLVASSGETVALAATDVADKLDRFLYSSATAMSLWPPI